MALPAITIGVILILAVLPVFGKSGAGGATLAGIVIMGIALILGGILNSQESPPHNND